MTAVSRLVAGAPRTSTTGTQVVVALLCLVLGLVVGLSSVALHHYWWGLVLAVAATSTAAYALPAGWWTRIPFAVGFAAMVGYLALPKDEGDYAIASDVQGYVLLGFAVGLVVGSMVTLQPIRGRNTADPPSGS